MFAPVIRCVRLCGEQREQTPPSSVWADLGRYSPTVNGKRMARNVYALTKAECEAKLTELIRGMKQEIAAKNAAAKAG